MFSLLFNLLPEVFAVASEHSEDSVHAYEVDHDGADEEDLCDDNLHVASSVPVSRILRACINQNIAIHVQSNKDGS